jgi:acetoacetate decarboxylase
MREAVMGRIRYGARSSDELRNREVEATSVDTWATVLVAVYETDPDAVAAVLPPPLSPPESPLVRVTVATVDVGRGIPPFGAGTFAVHARHEGVDGDYALVMPMTTEQSVVGGRETFGEPKKLAQVTLDRDGDTVHAAFARMGVTFLEINGRVTGDRPIPPDATRTSFYLKFLPSPDGKGFDADPALVYVRRAEKTRSLAGVDAEVVLRESRFDPVVDLPVRRLADVEFGERSSVQTGQIITRVPGDWIAPYVHQRYDDLSPVGTE